MKFTILQHAAAPNAHPARGARCIKVCVDSQLVAHTKLNRGCMHNLSVSFIKYCTSHGSMVLQIPITVEGMQRDNPNFPFSNFGLGIHLHYELHRSRCRLQYNHTTFVIITVFSLFLSPPHHFTLDRLRKNISADLKLCANDATVHILFMRYQFMFRGNASGPGEEGGEETKIKVRERQRRRRKTEWIRTALAYCTVERAPHTLQKSQPELWLYTSFSSI